MMIDMGEFNQFLLWVFDHWSEVQHMLFQGVVDFIYNANEYKIIGAFHNGYLILKE